MRKLSSSFQGIDNPYSPFLTLLLRIVDAMKRSHDEKREMRSRVHLNELRERGEFQCC